MSQSPRKTTGELGKVRPTTSKVVESVMASLVLKWEGARVLDLFAGIGSLGGAALEAGCAELVMIEGHTRTARELHRKLGDRGRVLIAVLPDGLEKLEGRFDVVLVDPPYGDPVGPQTLEALAAGPLIGPATVVVVEHHHKDAYKDNYGSLHRYRQRRFGETAVSYYGAGEQSE